MQVAVVAPYIYKLSRESDNDYFNVGLKLVAGSIVVMNVRPILVEAAPVLKVLADATMNAAKQNAISAEQRASAVDAEFTPQS